MQDQKDGEGPPKPENGDAVGGESKFTTEQLRQVFDMCDLVRPSWRPARCLPDPAQNGDGFLDRSELQLLLSQTQIDEVGMKRILDGMHSANDSIDFVEFVECVAQLLQPVRYPLPDSQFSPATL